jgi:DNA-binding beta-propeller fold protein YncE
VTTLAGVLASAGAADGIGAEARFDEPSGLAAYGGYLYVADSRNYTIRRIDLATAEVTTLAGSPGVFGLSDGVGADALFQAPSSVTSDGAGSLYVADPDNHLVRRVSLDTGAVTTGVGSMGVEAGVRLGSFPARLNHPSNVVAISPDALVIVDESALLLARF